MLRSSTALETLIAELFGDMAGLIERAESFATTMQKAQDEMTSAAWLLDSRVEPFRHALAAEIDKTKIIAVKAFIYQTNEVAKSGLRHQTQAMTDAARTIFEKEMALPQRQLVAALQGLINQLQRPWETLLAHTATAVVSAAATGIALHFFGR